MAMKGFEGEGKMTSFMLDTDARQAILLMVGSKGMGAYLRDVIRADLTARGLLGKKPRAAAVKKAPEPDVEPPLVEPVPVSAPKKRPPRTSEKAKHPLNLTWKSITSQARTKGIEIDPRWMDFWTFVEDMGPKPPDAVFARRVQNGPFSPDNCFWGTPKDVSRRSSRSPTFEFDGETLTLPMVARKFGINYRTLRNRVLVQNMTIGAAVSEPVRGASGERA